MPPLTPQSCRPYAVITLLVVAIAALVDYLLVMNAHLKYRIPPTGWKPPNPEDYHVDFPYDDEDESTHRLDISDLGNTNTVMCWPSVGSIVVARRLTAVELDFISPAALLSGSALRQAQRHGRGRLLPTASSARS
jgi:hypothetical protein